MPDDKDDILEISFDEPEQSGASEAEVLDISFGPATAARPRRPTPKHGVPETPMTQAGVGGGEENDLPMLSAGVCPACGYALRPLETECPRCARLGPPPVPAGSAPAEDFPQAEGGPPDLPRGASRRGCLVAGIIGSVLLLAIAIAIPIGIWLQPAQRAKREYQLGLQAQIKADFDGARQHYLKALELDSNMGLAAFSMGTTYLRIGDPALLNQIESLTQRATWGQTGDLDSADGWFRKTIEIGQQLPAGKRLMDQRIRTPAHLRAFAHACLALTAMIRASAAMQADALEDAMAWFQVVQREAQAALVDGRIHRGPRPPWPRDGLSRQ